MDKDTQQESKWDAQLRKGTLELAILAALKARPMYGLELLNYLHSFETMVISEGTLYPLLDRLKRDGLTDASWQQEGESRPRKFYGLTDKGREKLITLEARWHQSVADIKDLLAAQGKSPQTKSGV